MDLPQQDTVCHYDNQAAIKLTIPKYHSDLSDRIDLIVLVYMIHSNPTSSAQLTTTQTSSRRHYRTKGSGRIRPLWEFPPHQQIGGIAEVSACHGSSHNHPTHSYKALRIELCVTCLITLIDHLLLLAIKL